MQASTGDSSIQLNRILKKPDDDPDDAEVDEIVVDRTWSEDLKSSTVPSDHGGSPEKSGAASHQLGGSTDRESVAVQAQGIWATSMILIIIRYRIWPTIVEFFYPSFMDTKSEDHYRRELWFYRKVCLILHINICRLTHMINP
jgi:osomolarity two-component system, sensor histidine kinase SLN1